MRTTITDSIAAVFSARMGRAKKAESIADLIRQVGDYRWVGVYDVGPELVSIVAYSGPGEPAYPEFPIAMGLTGAAIRDKKPVIVGDVGKDPRYLTAFGSTLSEIIIPVLDEETGAVVGTIDVESERVDAFSEEDQRMIENYARAAFPLWKER